MKYKFLIDNKYNINNYENLKTRLNERNKNEKICLFVGAGLSKFCGLPSWNELANCLIDELYENKKIDFYTSEQYKANYEPKTKITLAYNMLKKKKFNEVLSEKLSIEKKDSNQENETNTNNRDVNTIQYFLKTYNPNVITTNADEILDYLPNDRIIYGNKLYSKDVFENPFVAHIHGSILDEKTLVFTLDQYVKAYQKDKFKDVLNQLFHRPNWIYIFMGTSLSELELLQYYIGKKENNKFIVTYYYQHEKDIMKQLNSYYKILDMKQIALCKDSKGFEVIGDFIEDLVNNNYEDSYEIIRNKEEFEKLLDCKDENNAIESAIQNSLDIDTANYFFDKLVSTFGLNVISKIYNKNNELFDLNKFNNNYLVKYIFYVVYNKNYRSDDLINKKYFDYIFNNIISENYAIIYPMLDYLIKELINRNDFTPLINNIDKFLNKTLFEVTCSCLSENLISDKEISFVILENILKINAGYSWYISNYIDKNRFVFKKNIIRYLELLIKYMKIEFDKQDLSLFMGSIREELDKEYSNKLFNILLNEYIKLMSKLSDVDIKRHFKKLNINDDLESKLKLYLFDIKFNLLKEEIKSINNISLYSSLYSMVKTGQFNFEDKKIIENLINNSKFDDNDNDCKYLKDVLINELHKTQMNILSNSSKYTKIHPSNIGKKVYPIDYMDLMSEELSLDIDDFLKKYKEVKKTNLFWAYELLDEYCNKQPFDKILLREDQKFNLDEFHHIWKYDQIQEIALPQCLKLFNYMISNYPIDTIYFNIEKLVDKIENKKYVFDIIADKLANTEFKFVSLNGHFQDTYNNFVFLYAELLTKISFSLNEVESLNMLLSKLKSKENYYLFIGGVYDCYQNINDNIIVRNALVDILAIDDIEHIKVFMYSALTDDIKFIDIIKIMPQEFNYIALYNILDETFKEELLCKIYRNYNELKEIISNETLIELIQISKANNIDVLLKQLNKNYPILNNIIPKILSTLENLDFVDVFTLNVLIDCKANNIDVGNIVKDYVKKIKTSNPDAIFNLIDTLLGKNENEHIVIVDNIMYQAFKNDEYSREKNYNRFINIIKKYNLKEKDFKKSISYYKSKKE